jgi:hypothetical protein
MMEKHSPQDWDQWAHNPLTQAFRARLQETLEESKTIWSEGGYTGASYEETHRLNTVALAGVDMLSQVIAQIDECELELDWKGNENE